MTAFLFLWQNQGLLFPAKHNMTPPPLREVAATPPATSAPNGCFATSALWALVASSAGHPVLQAAAALPPTGALGETTRDHLLALYQGSHDGALSADLAAHVTAIREALQLAGGSPDGYWTQQQQDPYEFLLRLLEVAALEPAWLNAQCERCWVSGHLARETPLAWPVYTWPAALPLQWEVSLDGALALQCPCATAGAPVLETVLHRPRWLLVHVGRVLDSHFTKDRTCLTLPPCLGPLVLMGIVVHSGGGAASGHYTVFTRETAVAPWYYYDDAGLPDLQTVVCDPLQDPYVGANAALLLYTGV